MQWRLLVLWALQSFAEAWQLDWQGADRNQET
jgi:hypothetical protein